MNITLLNIRVQSQQSQSTSVRERRRNSVGSALVCALTNDDDDTLSGLIGLILGKASFSTVLDVVVLYDGSSSMAWIVAMVNDYGDEQLYY